MGWYKAVLRERAGKLTETACGWFASLGAWIKRRMGEASPRRVVTLVVALSLWTGAGGMTASEAQTKPVGEVFGEVHWYEG